MAVAIATHSRREIRAIHRSIAPLVPCSVKTPPAKFWHMLPIIPLGVFPGAWMTRITQQRHYYLFIYAILLITSGLLVIKAVITGP